MALRVTYTYIWNHFVYWKLQSLDQIRFIYIFLSINSSFEKRIKRMSLNRILNSNHDRLFLKRKILWRNKVVIRCEKKLLQHYWLRYCLLYRYFKVYWCQLIRTEFKHMTHQCHDTRFWYFITNKIIIGY